MDKSEPCIFITSSNFIASTKKNTNFYSHNVIKVEVNTNLFTIIALCIISTSLHLQQYFSLHLQ